MTLLIAGLVLFLGIHSMAILAPGARARGVAALGANGWRAIYSVVSLAGLVLIIIGYGQSRLAPVVLYWPPSWLRYVTLVLMVPVFPLLIAAYLPGRIRGVLKHPMLVAVKTWALAHLLSNGALADLLLFGGFLAWAVANRVSLKHRASSLPGVGSVRASNDLVAVALGLALYVATLLWLHRALIGMPLL